jgi:branched-chain amino acid transport system substrate-binding protein
VGIAALKGAANPKDRKAIRDAIAGISIDTVVGRVDFKGSPLKNIGLTHIVGGQWQKTQGGKFPFDLKVVNNDTNPAVPTNGTLQALKY